MVVLGGEVVSYERGNPVPAVMVDTVGFRSQILQLQASKAVGEGKGAWTNREMEPLASFLKEELQFPTVASIQMKY